MFSHLEAIAVIVLSADPREKEGKKRGEKEKMSSRCFFPPPLAVEQQRNKILFHLDRRKIHGLLSEETSVFVSVESRKTCFEIHINHKTACLSTYPAF